MPSDLVVTVRQISNYPPISAPSGTENVLVQDGLGAPYHSISTADLVATALHGGPALGVGMAVPDNAAAAEVFAAQYIMPADGALAWNAYVDAASDGWRLLTAGSAASMGWDRTGGWGIAVATQGSAGQPLTWVPMLSLSNAGALSLSSGTLTVARDPAANNEVVTLNYLANNTVSTFNNRNGAVQLNSQDVYNALQLCDPIATQPWVQQAITSSLQNLMYTCPFVNTWNGRKGSVYLMLSDITCVFYQPGQQPVSPTPIPTSNDDSIATTKWVTQAFQTDGGTFLPIGGGTMLGPLLLNTVPVNADAGVVAVDTDMLRAYGFVGGGVGSTLASKYATLAAAQAIYPHAQALTDTLDWAAIQGLINAVDALPGNVANAVAIFFPLGDVIINRPIVTGAKSVYLRGAGALGTRILCSAAIDLFQHGLAVQNAFAAFEMENIGLYCTVPGTGYAINIRQDMSSGIFRLNNVRILSFSSGFSWLGFVLAEGTTNSCFNNVWASGGEFNPPGQQAGMTQIGFQFNSPGNDDRSFVFYFTDSEIGAIQHAVFVNITGPPGNSGSVEGMIFRGMNGRTNTGAWLKIAITQSQGLWQPPYFVFDDCNMQSGAGLIDADGISELHINDCLFYLEAPQSGTSTGNYINLTNVHEAYINNNTVTTFAGASLSTFIWFGPNSQNCFVRDNTFYISDPSITVSYAGIGCDSTVQNIRTQNNIYFGNWPAGVPYEVDSTNGGNGNRMDMSNANRIVIANGHGPALQLLDATQPVANYLALQPAAAGYGPSLEVVGSDANAFLVIAAKGNGTLYLNSPTRVGGGFGVNGVGPIAMPTVTGSRGANAALQSLVAALASYGLIADNTTP